MNRRKMMSIAAIVAISAVFVTSSALANPTLAQTSKSKGDSSSASNDYKDFQKCLSSAEDTKGYATKQEIKDCFNQTYNPTSNTGTTTGTAATGQ